MVLIPNTNYLFGFVNEQVLNGRDANGQYVYILQGTLFSVHTYRSAPSSVFVQKGAEGPCNVQRVGEGEYHHLWQVITKVKAIVNAIKNAKNAKKNLHKSTKKAKSKKRTQVKVNVA